MILTGCGAGGSAPSATPRPAGPIPKADYVTQADAICTKLGPKIATLILPKAQNPGTVAQAELPGWATYFGQLSAIAADAYAQLDALPNPDQGADVLITLRQHRRDALADAGAIVVAAQAGSLEQFRTARQKYVTDSTPIAALEQQFGFKVCGHAG